MIKGIKRLCSSIIAATMVLSIVPKAYAYEPSFWAEDAVNNATRLSIISEEYSTKSFQEYISRSDFVNVAVNLYATLTSENVSTGPKQPFSDTNDVFANMAYYTGLESGDGEGHFLPQGTQTRQEH